MTITLYPTIDNPVTLKIRQPIYDVIASQDWDRLFKLLVQSVEYPALLTNDEQAFVLGVLRQIYNVDVNKPAPTYIHKRSEPFYIYAYGMCLNDFK